MTDTTPSTKGRDVPAIKFQIKGRVDASLSYGEQMGFAVKAALKAGANLAGAYLAGAYLAGAKWCDGIILTKAPIQIYGLTWAVTILDTHMQIGCELHSHDEWAAFELLGARPDDQLDDLFPGTGAVTRAWHTWKGKFALPPLELTA